MEELKNLCEVLNAPLMIAVLAWQWRLSSQLAEMKTNIKWLMFFTGAKPAKVSPHEN